jgi:hypothetical protein
VPHGAGTLEDTTLELRMRQAEARPNRRLNGIVLGCGAALLVAGVAGCRSSTAPDPSPDVGIIDFYANGTAGVVEAPASVQVGRDFTVTVRTFGGGCVSAAGASVTYHRPELTLAVIVPYDNSRLPPGTPCADVLTRPARDVTLRFTTPGTATIRVEGRREPDGGRAVVEVPVTVAPL